MSFGKKDGNSVSSLRQIAQTATAANAPRKSAGSGLDVGFIALAMGVVVISAGGAIAAPSVMSMFSGSFASGVVRPIPTVIAGLDREHVKAALAREAFPDKHGAAFMQTLAVNFPQEHDRLVGVLADTAMKGGDRDAMILDLNKWGVEFAIQNMPAIGRTGAKGFDQALDFGSDALSFVEQTAGGCTPKAIMAIANDPQKLMELSAYDSRSTQFGMDAYRKLVALAAEGRNAPAIDTTPTPKDEQALQAVVMSLMMDERVTKLVRAASEGNASAASLESTLDVCELGDAVIAKLKRLPADTKARIWAMGAAEAVKSLRSFPLAGI
ncbi:MAG TPA: hypothetical protein VFV70_05535 [Hyphomonadaceae bacterium]|nr:hypothetical protein [Hyphomonadaceae bacterium]